jgi:hypothetical protein
MEPSLPPPVRPTETAAERPPDRDKGAELARRASAASPGPSLVDFAKAKSAAELDRQSIGQFDDGQGFAQRKRQIEADWLTAQELYQKGALADAWTHYQRVTGACEALRSDDQQRRQAVRAQADWNQVRAKVPDILFDQVPTAVTQFINGAAQVEQVFESGDFAGAERQWRDQATQLDHLLEQHDRAKADAESAQAKWQEAKRRQEETARALGIPVTKRLDLGGGVTMELVLIPPGEFVMGSPASEAHQFFNERPERTVRISQPFYLGRTEVTQAQWQAVMRNNPSYFKGDDLPVENVSWNDAQKFCQELSERFRSQGLAVRLPSEAEWEYACRAGTTTPFHFGNTITTDQANYKMGTTSMEVAPRGCIARRRYPWGAFRRTLGACMTCTGTCGSGVRTGTESIRPEV